MNAGLTKKTAVLGLGIIGSRVCGRLAAGGMMAACWNRTARGMEGETATPEEAVGQAEVVSIYLKDATALREVASRIRPVLRDGMVVMNHSTVDLDTTCWLGELCRDAGCGFLDAPFTGSKMAAGEGKLVYYIGGDAALGAAMDPLLALSSRMRLACGPVGAATVVKLATNLIAACTVQALAESLAIATRHGVTAECLMRAVAENVSASPLAAMKFPAMVAGDYDTHFSLSNMGKDSRYMLALADAARLDTPAIAAVCQRLAELCAAGLGELDYSALAKPYLG